ncbi:hypothetical protein FA13DRAFT_150273 [Coprinellus micaceus]|uniref:Uncharacterized protein n=1 Tax=Coprinellus micaceus TaxID=71717 RepID=A0A4Y7THD5_COPMI|nr:hypothetical protein FA13DRAFT_150273 [Coprinellus micaceus]
MGIISFGGATAIDSQTLGSPTRHFGAVLDRRSDLLVNLEEGDFLGVRVCVRFDLWTNYADSGIITARLISEDLFTHYRWTLSSEKVPTLPTPVVDGCYNIVSSTGCSVNSEGNELVSKIWFTTPALNQHTIDHFESIQLFTSSCLQLSQDTRVPQGECFSWQLNRSKSPQN